MEADVIRIVDVKPALLPCADGGWLAISPKWARFLIGVFAQTKEEAENKFRSEFLRWVSIVDDTVQKNT